MNTLKRKKEEQEDKEQFDLEELAQEYDYAIPFKHKERKLHAVEVFLESKQMFQKFQIGLIIGNSGCGKSTLLKQIVHKSSSSSSCTSYQLLPDPSYSLVNIHEPIASHFANKEEASERLNMASICSIPTWFRPFADLSDGENARFHLAYSLQSYMLVDEFTSKLDRLTAKSLSYSLQRFIRSNNNNPILDHIIFASCHKDMISWLQPDFVFDMNTGEFLDLKNPLFILPKEWKFRYMNPFYPIQDYSLTSCLEEKQIVIAKAQKENWNVLYAPHHYLNSDLMIHADCYEAWIRTDNYSLPQPIAFLAILPFPTIPSGSREHRLVVLPCVQGIGIGSGFSNALGKMYVEVLHRRYFSRTSHALLGEYRNRHPELWRATSKNKKASVQSEEIDSKFWSRSTRIGYSHEYHSRNKTSVPSLINLVSKEKKEEEESWKPLTLLGSFYKTSKSIWLHFQHKKYKFSFEEYEDAQEAAIEKQEELMLENQTSIKFNRYLLKDKIIQIELRSKEDSTMIKYAYADEIHLHLLQNHYWSLVFTNNTWQARAKINKSYILLQEHLFTISKYKCSFKDKNHLNCTRENIIFLVEEEEEKKEQD